jgi:hypothetical protein
MPPHPRFIKPRKPLPIQCPGCSGPWVCSITSLTDNITLQPGSPYESQLQGTKAFRTTCYECGKQVVRYLTDKEATELARMNIPSKTNANRP